MSNDKMRSEFEAWADKELLPLNRNGTDDYKYSLTCNAWKGWQAALEHKPEVSQPVAEGYLVNAGGSGEHLTVNWIKKPVEGLLYSAQPDYEALQHRYDGAIDSIAEHRQMGLALKAENESLKKDVACCISANISFKRIKENLEAENEALKLRVAAFEKLAEDHAQSAESYAEQAKKYSDRCGDLMEERDRLRHHFSEMAEVAEKRGLFDLAKKVALILEQAK